MENPWKLRMAAVTLVLGTALIYLAFFTTRSVASPLYGWIDHMDFSGRWIRLTLWGVGTLCLGVTLNALRRSR
jgi:hypothetical protein